MSPERPTLPSGWFAAVALVAFVAAAAVAFALLRPFAPAPVPHTPTQPGASPSTTPPQAQTPTFPPAAPRPLRLPTPRQLDGEGHSIAWGEVAPGDVVKIELDGVDRDGFVSAEFFLAKNEEAAQAVGQGFAAALSGLAPGRYRWSALLSRRDDGPAMRVDPPAGDGRLADFIVVPPAPVLQRLTQTLLDGKPMPADRRSVNGARLEAELEVPFPGAVVEFEVKAAGVAFDGNGMHRVAAGQGRASLSFTGAEGSYRWRARATAGKRPSTAWQRPVDGRDVDFAVIAPPATPPPAANPPGRQQGPQTPPQERPQPRPDQKPPNSQANPLARPPGEISHSSDGSGGIASGRNEPLESVQEQATSFWQVAFMRILIGIGVAAAVLVVLLGGVSGVRTLVRRKK